MLCRYKSNQDISKRSGAFRELNGVTTALFFIEPFSDSSYLDNPNTYFGKIDENNTYDEIDTDHEEVTPSYAQNNQDYRLLRRSQRSNVKRTNRREHKRHNR